MNPKASFENPFRSKLRSIISLLIRDNSANKLLFASLLKFESHYPPLCGIVQLTNFPTLRYGNWSFTNKFLKNSQRRKLLSAFRKKLLCSH
jgi:hypothetical protein